MTGAHPAWSGEGARLFGQRWTPPGHSSICTGTSFAVCLVEMLVRANRKTLPTGARYVEAVVPDDLAWEEFDPRPHPGWGDRHDVSVAQAYGKAWIEARGSALLVAPSVVAAGRDVNIVVNPDHPDCGRIVAGPEMPAALDPRLFGR